MKSVGESLLDQSGPTSPQKGACDTGQKGRASNDPECGAPASDTGANTGADIVVIRNECVQVRENRRSKKGGVGQNAKIAPKVLMAPDRVHNTGSKWQTLSDMQEESRSDAQNGERNTIGGTSVYAG